MKRPTAKRLTKRQKKAERGPNAMVRRSLEQGNTIKMKDGSIYHSVAGNLPWVAAHGETARFQEAS